MSITKIDEHIFMIDVEAADVKNYVASYILKGENTAIIETGPSSSVHNLIQGLAKLGIKKDEVSYIAVSHIHLDHAGGVGKLIKHLPRAKVLVHQKGALHLSNPDKLWQQSKIALGEIAESYGEPEPIPPDRIVAAYDGMILDFGEGVMLKVVETLGHASHHLCFYDLLSNGIFTGDAAGIYLSEIGEIVPTTPAPFRLDLALNSLDELANLKPKVLYYTHFGRASNAPEKIGLYANQLKLWTDVAMQALNQGEDLEATSRRIAEIDEAAKKSKEYIEAHRIMRKTVLKDSVRGIIDYIKSFVFQA